LTKFFFVNNVFYKFLFYLIEKGGVVKKERILSQKVESIEVGPSKSISKLLEEMANTGFQGRKLAEICDVYSDMINDRDVTILFGYSGSLSVAGQWTIVNWLMERGYIDILIPTGANISEDIVEAMGFSYYKGASTVDDDKLFDLGLNRYYDVYGKEKDYLDMTEMIAAFYMTLDEYYPYSSRELLFHFGKWLKKKRIESIVTVAADHGVPIFCPAIVDSPYGDAALITKSKGFNLVIDAVKDYTEFMSLAEKVKETGVVYIGGGVPKDFIQLFAVTADLLYPDRKIPGRKGAESRKGTDETYYPHKYAIQITTDSPQWGGLSGCSFEEAISWGKETSRGRFTQCYCDATIALPIITHALAEKIKVKRKRKSLLSLF
jgi:deoxyhypusine synthase